MPKNQDSFLPVKPTKSSAMDERTRLHSRPLKGVVVYLQAQASLRSGGRLPTHREACLKGLEFPVFGKPFI